MRATPVLTTALAAALALGVVAFAPSASSSSSSTPAEGQVAATATRSGDTVRFDGVANLADPGPAELPNFFVTPFAQADVADAIGIDLDHATIEELDDASGLRFTWHLASGIPADGVPEGVRYNWAFQAGDQTYQLQVKRTNLVNSTTAEAPLEHVFEAAEGDWFFQLRGACVAAYPAPPSTVNGCYHLGFFEGDVDLEAGTVSMELPYEASDDIGRTVAGTFQRGTPITEAQSASMSVTASAQAVVSNTASSAFLNGWGTYYPGTVVSVALGNASGPSGAYALLDTAGDGSFGGTLSGAGDRLWVRACSGYGLVTAPCVESSHAIG